ncbi:low temperature requirement protein A [Rhizobium laguerreae]|uniref:low temperature requirement protein A n=1 Tax=Rhizobium laguerreae TaxID=1076926 RepID=UPI001C8FFF2B|nr:low temperature requirement protein A [Rhizobium laguerreae]MBY3128162.1 hypothetical protein [Rhizobium laguerreae]
MASDRSRNWVRKEGAAQTRTSFPELFFDLVFVFALIQLSHALASDFSSTAAIESLLLIFAIWWVWINTTWVTNLLDTDKDPVRLLLFGLMFGGILLAIAIPQAFGEQDLVFAAIYCAMQVGRSVFALYAFRGVDPASSLTFLRITLWMLVSSVFWIAGALEARPALWSLALLIEYASPAVRYYVPGMGKSGRETLDVSGEHMAERCALFVIICLGETILTTGRNAAEHMAGDLTFTVFCSSFLSTGFMWWIYFHHGQEKAADKAEATSKPESVALSLFTYGHLPIVAGIILTAVGQDFSLSHASEESTAKEAVAILGGPALFLIGNIWVKLAAAREIPVSHIVGLFLFVMIALLLSITENYHIQMLATAVLFVVALWEYLALRRIAPSSA